MARDCLFPLRVLAVCRVLVLLWILRCVCFAYNIRIWGPHLGLYPMLAVHFAVVRLLCVVADRYQVPSITYHQVFDTAHTRSISAYPLRLLVTACSSYYEYSIQMMRVCWYSTRNASCARSDMGGYCKLTCYLLRCCYCCCFCRAAASAVATAAHCCAVVLLVRLPSISRVNERPPLLHKRR